MNKYLVEFSRRANSQLRSIFSYIAEDNADAALKMVDRLEARARQLEDTPFILYYRIINQTVYITHIIHSKRNQAKALGVGMQSGK